MKPRLSVFALVPIMLLVLTACSSDVRSRPAAVSPRNPPSAEAIQAAIAKVPFVATSPAVIAEMLKMANVSKKDVLYDLGSGDGRIVIAAAKDRGARGVGIDIDLQRVREASQNAHAAGVSDRVRFIQQDLFDADLHDATAVTLYLVRSVNVRLRPKLFAELRPGTRVVSHQFDMGEWEPDAKSRVGEERVFLWIIPAQVHGVWRWSAGDGSVRTGRLIQNFQNVWGDVRSGSQHLEIRNGILNGSEITFEVERPDNVVEHYRGRVSGNTIEGTVWSGTQRIRWRAHMTENDDQ